MRQLWTDGTVTIEMVFAAQVLWDIYEISTSSGPTRSLPQIMKSTAEQIQKSFEFFVDAKQCLNTQNANWPIKDIGLIESLYQRITQGLLSSPTVLFKKLTLLEVDSRRKPHAIRAQCFSKHKEVADIARQIGADKMVSPSRDPAFLLTANPMQAGTLLLDVATTVEQTGIALANHRLSIFAVAHLYSALLNLGLLDTHWPQIDQVIKLHQSAVFANDVPKSAGDMVSRLSYRIGASSARNWQRFTQKKAWQLRTTAATYSVRQFFDSKEPLPLLISALMMQAEVHAGQSGCSSSSARRSKKPVLTPRHALQELSRYIEAVLPDIELDYVTLTKTCNKFFQELRLRLRIELEIEYPIGEGTNQGTPMLVLGILKEARNASSVQAKRKKNEGETRDPWGNAPQLMLARDMMKKLLSRDV